MAGYPLELLDGFGSSLSVNAGVLHEALRRLEQANLVTQTSSGADCSMRWQITPDGQQALANADINIRLRSSAG
jgi:predicted MarR family transcription regulator